MTPFTPKIATASNRRARCGGGLRHRIAQSLVGRLVSLSTDSHSVTHGIVTNVLNDTGMPRIVVHGNLFDLDQILTATPARFDS
ncbi:MAG TPA: hypothetical protein VMA35_14975 [Candidatus Sulfopaludibacter sp.]|nr:hypothetical protein [Candidatus Sulfopaludibacter sp.]